MDLDRITSLIQQGETTTLEFKKSTANLKAACESSCAFLNGDGGTVLIGVTDQANMLGQEISDKTKREIGIELAKITPLPHVEIFYIPLPSTNKYIIALHSTTDSTKRPYLYNGRAYIRIESNTLPMPREYLQQLTMNNIQFNHHWEDQPQSDISINDLNTEEILATITEGVLNGRIPEGYATQNPKKALQHLGLLVGNQITRAAVILFGKKPETIFPQCMLRLARFRGIDKSDFIDNKQIYGNVFSLMRGALTFANTHLPITSTFPQNAIRRVDQPLFPIIALREAITNAICHRDYSYSGGSISFAIFNDRLEIWSYGLLPPGLSIEGLTETNQSVPRNRRIANVLYYHKLFESWGRGVRLIVDECTYLGHPKPFYSQDTGGVRLTLPSQQPIGPAPQKQYANLTEQQIQHKQHSDLTERQQEMLTILSQGSGLSSHELRSKISNPPSERWIRQELNILKEKGYLIAKGQTTARKWYLIN